MPYKERITEKVYYSISEVSEITGLEQSTIRFWDSEFKIVKKRSRKGNRFFSKKDLQLFVELSKLHNILTIKGMELFIKGQLKIELDET